MPALSPIYDRVSRAWAKEGRGDERSRQSTINDHEQGSAHTSQGGSVGMCVHTLGHVAQVRVRVDPEGIPFFGFSSDLMPLPPVNWRGLRLASFSRIQIGGILPRQLVAGCAFAGALVITNSMRTSGSRRSRAHTLPVKPFLQSWAYRDFHHRRLSKLSSLAGSINASKSGQALGNIIRERGQIVQGRGHRD